MKRRRREYSLANAHERLRGLADAARQIAREEHAAKTEDIVMKLLELGSPLTQENYLRLAYMGDKHSIEELGPEELAELPEGFEEWPRTEKDIQ